MLTELATPRLPHMPLPQTGVAAAAAAAAAYAATAAATQLGQKPAGQPMLQPAAASDGGLALSASCISDPMANL